MQYKRKKQNRTDYLKRLKLLKSDKPRLVIRKSLRNLHVQIIKYEPDGDKTLVSVNSKELRKFGYKAPRRNIPTAYLVGALIAKKSKEKSIKSAVPDTGFYQSIGKSLLFSVVKGAKEGGLEIDIDEKAVPSQDRVEGKHIVNYASKNKEKFSKYGMNPMELSINFNEVKNKLISNETKKNKAES